MELLAPAGSFPAFEAALEAGADSVYVGAPGFNARALSRDFTMAEIGSMISQAHGQGVRLYIAMNSLVKESELPAALNALSCFEKLRPDALIIQDLGLLYLARSWFPDLPLHASTLMSVHNSMAAAELTGLGFERVVLARELTIEEMAEIHRESDAEIEVFIHGAMCFSYSGLCMFSSLHGGKSSLRGQCVQPCRRQYSWLTKDSAGYLFSMNDLCGVDVLPELRDAGVRCLKIEGRMKSAQYVANTVAAYRMALDCMDEEDTVQEKILRRAHVLLDDAMARKRSSGYLLSEQPGQAISPQQSGSSGRMLGRILNLRQQQGRGAGKGVTLELKLMAQVKTGDRLRLLDENSGKQISFTLRELEVQGQRGKVGRSGQRVRLSLQGNLKGMKSYGFQGSLFKVDVGSRIVAERSGRKRSEKLAARKVAPDRSKVESILASLAWGPGSGKSRSMGKRKKTQEKYGKRHNKKYEKNQRSRGKELPWWVAVARLGDVCQRLPVRAFRFIVPFNRDNIGLLKQAGGGKRACETPGKRACENPKIKKQQAKIIWQLPTILHERDLDWYRQQVRQLVVSGFNRFQLSHCSQYGLFLDTLAEEEYSRLELSGNYSLNILNSAALLGASHLGFRNLLFSLETEGDNLAAALRGIRKQVSGAKRRLRKTEGRGQRKKSRQKMIQVGLYVYGRPPLFTARLASEHFNYQQTFVSPRDEQFSLEQRDGVTLARAALPFSLLDHQQELADMGVDYLLLDLSGGPIQKEIYQLRGLLGQGKKRIEVLSGNFSGILV